MRSYHSNDRPNWHCIQPTLTPEDDVTRQKEMACARTNAATMNHQLCHETQTSNVVLL